MFEGGYTLLPNVLVRLGGQLGLKPHHYALVIALLGSRGSSGIFPSVATLARMIGAHRVSVQKWLRELEEMGILKIERQPGRTNHYDLSPLWVRIKELLQSGIANTCEDVTESSTNVCEGVTDSCTLYNRGVTESYRGAAESYTHLLPSVTGMQPSATQATHNKHLVNSNTERATSLARETDSGEESHSYAREEKAILENIDLLPFEYQEKVKLALKKMDNETKSRLYWAMVLIPFECSEEGRRDLLGEACQLIDTALSKTSPTPEDIKQREYLEKKYAGISL